MFELCDRDYGFVHFDEDYDLEAQLAAIRGALAAGRAAARPRGRIQWRSSGLLQRPSKAAASTSSKSR
jgi:hypothetical protein